VLLQHKSKNHQIREALKQKLVEHAANSDLDARDLSVNSVSEENCSEDENDPIGDFEELENFIDKPITSEEILSFQEGYADFLKKLLCFHFVPMSALAEINSEIKSLISMGLANKVEHFKRAMQSCGINESTVNEILSSVASCEDLVLSTFDLFKNIKCIEKYMTNNKNYVEPKRMPLGEREFQYISIIETLKRITGDPSFKNVRNLPKTRSKDEDENLDFCLADVDDGRRIREIEFFKTHPDALRLFFYSDVLQVTNALGGAKHKMFCVYMSLGDRPRHERSKVDHIFLVAVAEQAAMKDKWSEVFMPLVTDLKCLEEGVDGMKAGILAYFADNLEAHDLGMFQRNFNHGFPCHFCHVKHSDLKNCDRFLRDERWGPENYNRIVTAIQNDDDTVKRFYLRGNCVLNELSTFHATTTFAPDLMHDFLGNLHFTILRSNGRFQY